VRIIRRDADRSCSLRNHEAAFFAYPSFLMEDRAFFYIAAIVVIVLAFISRTACSAEVDSASAIQFVSGLYGQLAASGEALKDPLKSGTDATTGPMLLEPALVALSKRDGMTHPNEPGISVSLCNCQEGPVTDVGVRAIAAGAGRTDVEAKFKVGGTPRIMRLLLVGDGAGGWQQIPDLRDWTDPAHPWSVRRAMALDVAADPGPVRPIDTVGRWAGHDCQRDWTDWHWDGHLLSFTAPNGHVDVEQWLTALKDGFVTETIIAPHARWEYQFTSQGVRVRNLSTGRGFSLTPCE
jgi:hypothetical protein